MGVKARWHHGQYYLFFNHNKQRFARPIGKITEKVANELAIRAAAEVLKGDIGMFEPKTANVTLEAHANEWLTERAPDTCRTNTIRTYRYRLEQYVLPYLGKTLLTDITATDIKAMLAHYRKQGRSANTLAALLAVVSAAIEDARSRGLLKVNPANDLSEFCTQPNALPIEIRPLTKSQTATFLDAARRLPRIYPMVLVALRTGVRLGELLALQWSDVNFDDHLLTVRRSVNPFGEVTAPKNGLVRSIPLSAETTKELRALRAARTKEIAARKWDEDLPWLFVTERGNRYRHCAWRARHYSGIFKYTQPRVPYCKPHNLRHTFATRLLQDHNASLQQIQKWLGHANIQITVDTYGHLMAEGNRAAIAALDA